MKKIMKRILQTMFCAGVLGSCTASAQAMVQIPSDDPPARESSRSGSSHFQPGVQSNRFGGPDYGARGSALPGSVIASLGPADNLAASTASADQEFPAAIPDGAGGMILVWMDLRSAAETGWDLYAQHVLACGRLDPDWPADGVPVTRSPREDVYPVICSDGAGGAFVVWWTGLTLGSVNDIYGQHLLAGGTVDPAWPPDGIPVCTAPGRQIAPKITFDGASGAFVTWDDSRSTRLAFVQHLLTSGVDPSWPVDGLAVCPSVASIQSFPVICSDGASGAIVAWLDRRDFATTDVDLYAQRVTSGGALLWAPSGVPVCTAPARQQLNGASSGGIWLMTSSDNQTNAIIPDGAGGCLVTWTDWRNLATTGSDVYAQRLTAGGSVAPGWPTDGVALCPATGDQDAPNLVPDGSGGAVGTWWDTRPAPYAQHVSGAGVVTGPPGGLALSGGGGTYFVPQGVSDGAGGVVFVWSDDRDFPTSDFDAYGQHVTTSAGLALDPAWPPDGAPVSTAVGAQYTNGSGSLVPDGAGGAVFAWEDLRDYSTTGLDVYVQGLLASGQLPQHGGPVAAITSPASGAVFPVGTPVSFLGSFTDSDPGSHSAEWQFDALAPLAGTVNEAAHTVSGNYTFTTPGVYLVRLTVADRCGGSSTTTQIDGFDAMVVVYDPSAGFVTGGGWIDSPAGAYVPDPALVGRANFGFVAKYQRGSTVPTGNTEFQFRAGNLNFSSSSYDWLVVAGARAQYKGEGKINGTGTYRFMLTAIDGNLLGGQSDRFRMKITNASGGGLVYDNQLNDPDSADPTTILGGGSIVVHKPNGVGQTDESEVAGTEIAVPLGLSRVEPNPFRAETLVHYAVAEPSRVEMELYDVTGRRVSSLVPHVVDAGTHEQHLANQDSGGHALAAGIYFLRWTASPLPSGTSRSEVRKLVVTP